ncbi:DUF4180 domain-containing protein [Xenorhabdus lircayensis]|uniref:DUF4180 domain-containing protein n=1 Tax=Xenorhabdus lircayensis TaxID=2763499 RepID=A0ABS0UBY8_9GAMM|nr:DUF4180 domain-containing protein [Xenorhabdus lircayensis]MBI6550266.1 DUF4180 domain-containing protein [Xenorhabdus lircayensis]
MVNIVERNTIHLLHITDTGKSIRSRQDILDIILGHEYKNIAGIAIDKDCFHPDFFRLKTGMAGEILQMFVNYQTKVAIIGDLAKYTTISASLRDFIVESNRGNQIFFVSNIEEAFGYFSRS